MILLFLCVNYCISSIDLAYIFYFKKSILRFPESNKSDEGPKLYGKLQVRWDNGIFNVSKIKHGISEEYDKLLGTNNRYLVLMNLLSDDCIDGKCSSGFIMPISKDIIVSSNKKIIYSK